MPEASRKIPGVLLGGPHCGLEVDAIGVTTVSPCSPPALAVTVLDMTVDHNGAQYRYRAFTPTRRATTGRTVLAFTGYFQNGAPA